MGVNLNSSEHLQHLKQVLIFSIFTNRFSVVFPLFMLVLIKMIHGKFCAILVLKGARVKVSFWFQLAAAFADSKFVKRRVLC